MEISHVSVFSSTLSCSKLLIMHTKQTMVRGRPNIDQKVFPCRVVDVYTLFSGGCK